MSVVKFPLGRGISGVRVIPVFALAAALAGLTACGSSGSSTTSTTAPKTAASGATTPMSGSSGAAATSASSAAPASASPAATGTLTGTAASALAAKAIAGTKAATSVRVAGQNVGTGTGSQQVTFDITLVKNVGCTGTIALSKTQTFKIIESGGYVWMLPNSSFYSSLHISKAAEALLADKYLKVKSTDKQIGSLSQICSFSGLFGQLPKPTGTSYTATPSTYQGQPAYNITRSGKPGTAVVSNTATPLLLEISDLKTSNGGAITFSDYNAMTTITTPSAAETVDGTELGI